MNLKLSNFVIVAISVLLPVVVTVLYYIPKFQTTFFSSLSTLNAVINGLTFFLLLLGVKAIKNKKKQLHKMIMLSCFFLSVLFLICYVLYHLTNPTTKYGGEGVLKYIYYFLLITHILLSVIIVPLVLYTFAKALKRDFEGHKKIARITLPLWLYVTFSGVLVYLFIFPYY